VPPRLFLHEFLKPREDIKESMQARRVFEYKCTQLFMHPGLLCQQKSLILPSLLGGKNFMITSSTGQYTLFALN
jgi:hypothetical protein